MAQKEYEILIIEDNMDDAELMIRSLKKKRLANKLTKKIPVVVVTSSGEDPDITSAYDLEANSYIVKPVDFDSFTETMNQLGSYWLATNQIG